MGQVGSDLMGARAASAADEFLSTLPPLRPLAPGGDAAVCDELLGGPWLQGLLRGTREEGGCPTRGQQDGEEEGGEDEGPDGDADDVGRPALLPRGPSSGSGGASMDEPPARRSGRGPSAPAKPAGRGRRFLGFAMGAVVRDAAAVGGALLRR